MTTTNRLAFVLALALGATATGCSTADPSSSGDGGGGGGGSGGGDQHGALDATGTYAMHSTFDLASNVPGTAGTVVNTVIAATDDSDDPTRWIVDQILAQLPDGPVKDALQIGELLAVGYLNDRVLDIAPDLVSTMVQVGHDFGTIARNFGLDETFAVTGSGTDYRAVHTVVGAHWKLDNQEGDFTLANYHAANIVVSDVAVQMDPTGQLTIAAHTIPLTYGKLLQIGLDAAIIPLIDPTAHNLNDLLAHKIDCAAVADAIHSAIKLDASLIKAACTTGLSAAADLVYREINAINDTALQFAINGTARAVDRNGDRHIDAIQSGTWSGTLSYATTPTPLIPAAFFGERM